MAQNTAHNRLRKRVYWWMEREDRDAKGPKILELCLIVLICLNVVAVIFETVEPIYREWQTAFDLFEFISLSLFTIEYFVRLWIVPENPKFPSRIRWAFSAQALVDLIAILPALLVYIVPIDLRVLRIFRMLRLLKLTRYSPALSMLLTVFEEEAGAFFAGFFILMLMLVFAASGAWFVEHKAQPEAFGSIPAAMWWALATLTTVGYGDVVPITVAGKVFGGIITILGIGMAALPAGIIASGLNQQIKERRASLKREFRIALEDGMICADEQTQIEAHRKKLGLSKDAANAILEEVIEKQRTRNEQICKHCGKPIDQ